MSAPKKAGGPMASTVALKLLMAITGAALAGFVLFHMAGNLQVFQGRDAYNSYAEFLQSLGGLLWIARLGLLGALGVHILCAFELTRRNKAARPEPYAGRKNLRTGLPALLMIEGGVVVLLFVIYHLAHFTLGVVHADAGYYLIDGERRDLYNHFVRSFSPEHWPVVLAYVVANVALGAHLAHGIQSMFKTLGIAVGRWRRPLELVGPAFGLVVVLGNVSMPIGVMSGAIAEESSPERPIMLDPEAEVAAGDDTGDTAGEADQEEN